MNKEELKENFKGYYKIDEVINYIDKVNSTYIYEYNNIKCIVYYCKNKDKIDFERIKEVIERGHIISNKSKKFIIHLLLTSAKKKFEKNKILTAKNTNSGFTYTNKNEIFIFRHEEFAKVIIHELIHHDKLLHNDEFTNINKKQLLNHFKISEDTILILNEAIIEFWATLIHLAFVSCKYNIDYFKLYEYELNYSLYKSYQILKLKEKNKNKIWCDKCNIYSYIIFKTILLKNINELFKTYTYPYDNTKITNFIIEKSEFLNELLKNPPKNPIVKINSQKIQRPSNSLCFMLLSDL
jgi:hypothetical protein